MSVLSVRNLSVSFGEERLFENVSFDVEKGDKIGFIGANGVGKTTLFKVINGELAPESGDVFVSKDTHLGYMQQHACTRPHRCVYDELVSVFEYLENMEEELLRINRAVTSSPTAENIHRQTALIEEFEREGGLTYKSRTRSALVGFGFDESMHNMPTGQLSGGQLSKLSLLKLLLSRSDLLLLDEPTNHLDIKAVSRLEEFVRDFKGSMIIISHDRYFLDRVTDKTAELEHKRIMMYKGNYTAFKEKKQAYTESLENKYENDLKEIKRIEGIVEQQKRWGRERNFITAASKQKEADRIKAQLVAPMSAAKTVHIRFEPKNVSGNDVLRVKGLSKSFGDNKLFENLDFQIRRGERVFIIGENGCGKTTLFNIIIGRTPADRGTVDFGATVDVGYFDQMQRNLSLNKTALDEVWDNFPNLTETKVRTCLGSFLFTGDQVFKPLIKMSGGERARVSLLKLMLEGGNFLLLDEPTNHLDSASREQLEETLLNYQGTLLIISHDRYFINKLATRTLEITGQGVVEYLGNYDYYLEKTAKRPKSSQNTQAPPREKLNDYQLKKQQRANERKLQRDIKNAEELIEQLDLEIARLNEILQSGEISCDYEKLMEITSELEQKQSRQEEVYNRWLELSK